MLPILYTVDFLCLWTHKKQLPSCHPWVTLNGSFFQSRTAAMFCIIGCMPACASTAATFSHRRPRRRQWACRATIQLEGSIWNETRDINAMFLSPHAHTHIYSQFIQLHTTAMHTHTHHACYTYQIRTQHVRHSNVEHVSLSGITRECFKMRNGNTDRMWQLKSWQKPSWKPTEKTANAT